MLRYGQTVKMTVKVSSRCNIASGIAIIPDKHGSCILLGDDAQDSASRYACRLQNRHHSIAINWLSGKSK